MASPRPCRDSLASLSASTGIGALRAAIWMLRRLGPVRSSNMGGGLARRIGPHLGVSRVADGNLRQALPELDGAARALVIRGVWDNLGRTVAELPHLASFKRTESGPGWEIAGEQHLDQVRHGGRQVVFFSGHFGNWEMVLPIAAALGVRVAGFYRAASNGRVDAVIQGLRRDALGEDVSMFAKGSGGARKALTHLAGGGSLGLLVDQKMNDGIAVPFFGRDAMTAPALAQMALRFAMPILPVHVERLGPGRFRMVCEAALNVPAAGTRDGDVRAISTAMNATLERWIRAEPEGWLWLHRRWPKNAALSPSAGAAVRPPQTESPPAPLN